MKSRYLALVAFALVALVSQSGSALIPAIPIPSQPTFNDIPGFQGSAARANPLRSFKIPRHPFMAPNGRSNIHNDAYMTDSYTWRGPLGRNTAVTSTWLGVEECASIGFDSHNRIVGLCGTLDGARLRLLDAQTLETLNVLPLPPRMYRPGTTPFNDFCAAGYFYLDNHDRAILSTNTNQVWVVHIGEFPTLALEQTYDLNSAVPTPDCLASVLPDWSGRLWFLSKGGVIGTIDRKTGEIRSKALGEAVANSFAVDETGGVFIVTDRAMYRFDAVKGAPHITWRIPYDRGSRLKPGMLSQGSGTSPTLVGSDLVAIADNADPKMNVLVYRRDTGKLVCKEPVFGNNAGATENSLIAVGRSLVVENNYGYEGVMSTANGASTTPGVARVDIDGCRTVWTSKEISPTTVAKASLATGLVYVYSKPARADGTDAWYFTAIDFRTGRTAFRKLTGIGYLYNNHYAPISLGPDGSAYIGSFGGLIRIADAY